MKINQISVYYFDKKKNYKSAKTNNTRKMFQEQRSKPYSKLVKISNKKVRFLPLRRSASQIKQPNNKNKF